MNEYAVRRIIKRWEAADRVRPKARHGLTPVTRPYVTPESIVDAFWYLVGIGDENRLSDWLKDHPDDADFLCGLRRKK